MLDLAHVLVNGTNPRSDSPENDGPIVNPVNDPHAAFRVKVVQVGIWEARRRLAAGQTAGLSMLLANLDEDIELLRRSLEEAPASSAS